MENGLVEIDMTRQHNELEIAGDLSDLVKQLESGSNKKVKLAHFFWHGSGEIGTGPKKKKGSARIKFAV